MDINNILQEIDKIVKRKKVTIDLIKLIENIYKTNDYTTTDDDYIIIAIPVIK